MPVDVSAAIAGLDALTIRIDDATRQIVADAAHIVQANVMREAPVGKPGNTTNAPGDLRRSIDVEGPHGAAGLYEARVGPTMIYSRQRELGGHIYPKTAAALVFRKNGAIYRVSHVYQDPNPYTARGEMASHAEIEAVVRARLSAAILGA